MLAIKWKNNKQKSLAYAGIITFAVTLIFAILFPFFKKSAENEYENPLMSDSFIRMIYGSNYVQYKYLKEKTDQVQYSYTDLLVDMELLDTFQDIGDDGTVSYNGDIFTDKIDEAFLRSFEEETLYELDRMKDYSVQLVQLMDYCAVDQKSNTMITNSDEPILQDIASGKDDPEYIPYSYYVRIGYDGAGNVENCKVHMEDHAAELLKRVEAAGRNSVFSSFDENGVTYKTIFDETQEKSFRYKFTLNRPQNMTIVYAMTYDQYQNFLSGFSDESGLSMIPDQRYKSYQSYEEAGVYSVFLGFLWCSIGIGAAAAWILNRGQRKGSYVFQDMVICRIPMEIFWFAVIIGLSLSNSMIELLCSYQKGWLFRSFSEGFLKPFYLNWLLDIFVFCAFYLCFLAAFIVGSTLTTMIPFGQYLRRTSILYRYWDKITTWFKNYFKKFYRDLTNFDIGKDANKMILRLVILNFIILVLISLMWVAGVIPLAVYSLILYLVSKRYVRDIQVKYRNLLKAASSIAKGNLDTALSEDFGVFESYKEELRNIQTDFKKAVDEEVKSQRMKTELITNVSHDLKTPLTAIITYINLLKEPDITEEQKREYLNTLDKKAVRLKTLIEDLFEVSKANSQNVTLQLTNVDINNLIRQCYLEYEDRFEESNLQVKFLVPDEKIILQLDPQKTFRIFENLFTNVVKYAMPYTRVYVILQNTEEEVRIELKNISSSELQIAPEELTERFVRGDSSRNTEGSGLGLAIARSFTELQKGRLLIHIDGDLFKVIITFPKV